MLLPKFVVYTGHLANTYGQSMYQIKFANVSSKSVTLKQQQQSEAGLRFHEFCESIRSPQIIMYCITCN